MPAAPTETAGRVATPPWYAETLRWGQWLRARPAAAAALLGLVAVMGFFLCGIKLFDRYTLSTLGWGWASWHSFPDYEHAQLVPLIFLFLVWNAQPKLRAARVGSSRWGWAFMAFGVICYLVAARALQPRFGLAAVPFLLFGMVLYIWGRQAARALLFPCAFLFFMIPLPGVEQATVGLQLMATNFAAVFCRLVGLHLQVVGTTIRAADASFQFEIAGGCSGIRSLMAITMLTAIFVHLTQDRFWKKATLFALSIVFAIVGNVARITAIMVVAKFFGQKFAGGIFHDLSTWIISFPFAFLAMYSASKLVNWRPSAEQRARWLRPTPATAATTNAAASVPAGVRPMASSYDY